MHPWFLRRHLMRNIVEGTMRDLIKCLGSKEYSCIELIMVFVPVDYQKSWAESLVLAANKVPWVI